MAHHDSDRRPDSALGRHPIIANILVILIIAALGLWIVYLSLALFTKHGQSEKVPGVENMTYTNAVQLLHSHGFRVDIRDSVYRDDVRPGIVVEQFPKMNSSVKPGRKIMLYINAVNPKEVVIDDDNNPSALALKGMSFRQAYAHLEELGFRNIAVVRVLGDDDRVVKVVADGRTVRKQQRVSVKARIILEVCDGRLSLLRDSLQNLEYANDPTYTTEYPAAGQTSPYDVEYNTGEQYDVNPEKQESQSVEPNASHQEETEVGAGAF